MGGVLTDIRGDKYRYDKEAPHMDSMGVLATRNPQFHAQVVAEIPPEAVQKLEGKK